MKTAAETTDSDAMKNFYVLEHLQTSDPLLHMNSLTDTNSYVTVKMLYFLYVVLFRIANGVRRLATPWLLLVGTLYRQEEL